MKKNNAKKPSIEYLHERLLFDPITGLFIWKWANLMPSQWNQRFVGKRAFSTKHSNGYLVGTLQNRKFFAHDVAWAMHYGAWHDDDIDHENHDRTDNRIENLAAKDRSGNMRNQMRRRDNTTGVTGVIRYRDNMWAAQIHISGQHIHLGVYADFQEAVAARKEAERHYGFHPNHGTVPEVAGALHIYNPEQLEVIGNANT